MSEVLSVSKNKQLVSFQNCFGILSQLYTERFKNRPSHLKYQHVDCELRFERIWSGASPQLAEFLAVVAIREVIMRYEASNSATMVQIGQLNDLGQRFPNVSQVGTTFISQNVLRTALLLTPLKANCLRFSTTACDTQFTIILFFLSFFGLMFNLRGPQG
jgi:hypothetical protein